VTENSNKVKRIDMRDAFFDQVYEMAKEDNDIVFLTADHGAFSLVKFEQDFPDRYINIGISEQNMIGSGAGLASSGKIVFAYGITPFVSLRVLEQLTIDLASMNLPVNIVSVGGGFTYSTDGPTHQGLQDLPAVYTIPNMTILNSSDPSSTKAFAEIAAKEIGPKYIRIEKGFLPDLRDDNHDFSKGFHEIKSGKDLTIVATGAIVHEAIKASDMLYKEKGLEVGVIDVYRIKPLPTDGLKNLLSKVDRLLTLEEGYLDGGLGSIIGTLLAENGLNTKFLRLGIENDFCFNYDSRESLLKLYELDAPSIFNRVNSWLQ